METLLVYPAGSTKACLYASSFLQNAGVAIVDHPTPEVSHLLLDVPSFGADGLLRGGGDLNALLRMLPNSITVVGGNLNHPVLESYHTIDLLQDAGYLASNAAITAECALQIAADNLQATFTDSPALVIGWGRIGKCLARLLRALGAEVTVAVRKETDLAMLRGLGYQAVEIRSIPAQLSKFKLIYNTVPAMVIRKEHTALCKNSVWIDLASKPGIEGSDVIRARGLPGVYAPESSGKLIAKTFLNAYREGF